MNWSRFENHLLLKGCSSETLKSYIAKAKQFEKNCSPLNQKTVENFFLKLLKEGKKPATVNTYLNILRQMDKCYDLKFVDKLDRLQENHKPHKEIFSDSEIEAIINLKRPACCNKKVWERWNVWLSVLAFSGMRPGEVSKLTIDQIDFGSNNFILEQTKTDPRRVPIASNLKDLLHHYIQDKDHYLFPINSKRGYVWRNNWNKHLNLRKRLLDIKRSHLTAHSFRHSFITNLWQENVPLPDIMNIVGHSDPNTTIAYSHLSNKSAQKSINRHSIIKRHTSPKEIFNELIEDVKQKGILDDTKFDWRIKPNSLTITVKKKVVD